MCTCVQRFVQDKLLGRRKKLNPPRLKMSKHPHILSDFGPVCVNGATVKFPEKGGRAELINIFGSSGRGQ